ncbi:hypothetical protein SAMN04487970_10225 [Paenibacillus tianmuensis]|uniref:Uncharacterized protein n=1 Tax=Paenibacillus tianmuensis TaxID=624147 RepID=A0A1G4S1K4_9BACL|nr:hypothetical protein [Paenibacillus tianmuensis]SCW63024.1 hypothetical protein SAMN04487970_10225 [Paenibacillus tianmuensis]
MTLRNKGSRKIVVGNDPYRWVISTASKGYIVLMAEHKQEKGRKLRIYIESDINDYWVEYPYTDSLNLKVVTPKEVATIISQAIEQGWNPKEKGPPMIFDWSGDVLGGR